MCNGCLVGSWQLNLSFWGLTLTKFKRATILCQRAFRPLPGNPLAQIWPIPTSTHLFLAIHSITKARGIDLMDLVTYMSLKPPKSLPQHTRKRSYYKVQRPQHIQTRHLKVEFARGKDCHKYQGQVEMNEGRTREPHPSDQHGEFSDLMMSMFTVGDRFCHPRLLATQ